MPCFFKKQKLESNQNFEKYPWTKNRNFSQSKCYIFQVFKASIPYFFKFIFEIYENNYPIFRLRKLYFFFDK